MIFADTLREVMPHLANELFEGTRITKVHRDVVTAAYDLIVKGGKKIPQLSRFTCWPDYDTWLEAEDNEGRFGFYFHGAQGKSVTEGCGLLVMMRYTDPDPIIIPVRFNMPTYELIACDLQYYARLRAGELGVDRAVMRLFRLFEPTEGAIYDPILYARSVAPFLTYMKPMLFTLLALINSPKLIRTNEVDVSRLNARRLKRGKYPYHPHHEVRLNIDKHDLKITQGPGDGPERGLHFVRAHLRFLVHPRYKNVSVVLVPPHTRGNPELGIRKTTYAVDRQNSRWVE